MEHFPTNESAHSFGGEWETGPIFVESRSKSGIIKLIIQVWLGAETTIFGKDFREVAVVIGVWSVYKEPL